MTFESRSLAFFLLRQQELFKVIWSICASSTWYFGKEEEWHFEKGPARTTRKGIQ